MGNHISFSSDDEFLRITIDIPQNYEPAKRLITELKDCPFIKFSFFTIMTLSVDLILLKIHINDLENVITKSFSSKPSFLVIKFENH